MFWAPIHQLVLSIVSYNIIAGFLSSQTVQVKTMNTFLIDCTILSKCVVVEVTLNSLISFILNTTSIPSKTLFFHDTE